MTRRLATVLEQGVTNDQRLSAARKLITDVWNDLYDGDDFEWSDMGHQLNVALDAIEEARCTSV